MYICKECGRAFDEDEMTSTSAESYYGVDHLFDYSCGHRVYFAPCGHEDYDEADRCPLCDEYKVRKEACCESCKDDLLTRMYNTFTKEEYDVLYDLLDGKEYGQH